MKDGGQRMRWLEGNELLDICGFHCMFDAVLSLQNTTTKQDHKPLWILQGFVV